MTSYPLILDLRRRRVLVVGGGPVGQRRTEGLLAAGARVTVISPTLTARLRALATTGRIRHIARRYRRGDLSGARLVFVAVDDTAASEAVAREARARRVLVNVADDPVRCDFLVPAVLRRGGLVVAVSTGGASPALARRVREELEAYFTEDWAAFTAMVAGVRRAARERRSAPGAEAWHRALGGEVRRLAGAGRVDEARKRLVEALDR